MLLASFALYFMPLGLLAAYITAVTVHELGHFAILKLFGLNITSLKITLMGCVIEHCGTKSNTQKLMCAASGPLAGIVFAFACAHFAEIYSLQLFEIFAGFSLALSLFNLLPCRPLDGAAVVEAVLSYFFSENTVNKVVLMISLICCLLLLYYGFFYIKLGYGYGIIVAGVCLPGFILFEEGIVKIRNMR